MDLTEKKRDGYSPSDRHPWELARVKLVIHQLSKYYKKNDSFSILDIGCGDAYVAGRIIDFFPNVTIIAVDSAFDNEYKKDLEHQFQGKAIDFSDDIKNVIATKIDLVLLLDVIEHIEDEVSFLKYVIAQTYIDAETRFIISVPAYQSLFVAHDVYLKHYRRYTNKTLIQAIEAAGLKNEKVHYFFFTLLIPRIIEKWKELLLGRKNNAEGIGNWKSKGFIDKLIIFVLYIDYFKLQLLAKWGIKLPGLSNLVVCRKSV